MQPCWTDAVGKMEELVRIVFHAEIDVDQGGERRRTKNIYDVFQRWPTYRDEEARRVGAHAFVKTGLTRDEFEALAQPILDWSNAQEPRCRHYFTVNVDEQNNFQSFLRAQDFLYPLVLGR